MSPPRTLGSHAPIADHTYLQPLARHAATTRKTLLRNRHGVLCLDQQQLEAARKRQRFHA
jgi:hypothetical protein